MRRFVMAVALACVLSSAVLAGDVHSVDATAPQPPSAVVTAILTIISIVV
jgi:hypothetical protein